MIPLNIQVKLIIFSFIFGFIFSILIDLFKKILKNINNQIKNIIYLITIIILSIIYLIGIYKICNTIFHIYSIICTVIGFVLYDLIVFLIAKQKK